MNINGRTAILGVIGDPVGHSLSPVMHNAVYQYLKWDCVYIPCRVNAADLSTAVQGIRALNFKGINVTVPHKQMIVAELDDVFGDSRYSGSVNTVINKDGKLFGTSTDGIGLVNSIQTDGGFQLHGKKTLLLGAGGTTAAVVHRLIDSGISKLIVVNRDLAKAVALQQKILQTRGFPIEVYSLPNLPELDWAGIDLIINTTSVGLNNDESLLAKELLQPHHFVYDVVYKKGETRLIREATAAGCQVLSGLSMLLFQGAESFKIWFEMEPLLDIMRQAIYIYR